MNRLPFDELNAFEQYVEELEIAGSKSEEKKKEAEDTILDILIMAYVFGTRDADEMLGIEIEPNSEKMREAIYKKIAGKDFEQRVSEYVNEGTAADIQRVVETDATRIYNTAVLDTGKASGLTGLKKTWQTMEDDRVRDTHSYLEGMTVDFEDAFYTYDGYHTLAPGNFGVPELDINCRCYITLSRG